MSSSSGVSAWNNFTATTNYLRSDANSEGIRGNATGFWFGMVFNLTDGAGAEYLAGVGSSLTTNGWNLRKGGASVTFRYVNGTPTAIQASSNWTASEFPYTHAVIVWHDGTNINIKLDAQATVSAATSGTYTAPAAADRFIVGVRNDNYTAAFTDGEVIAAAGGDSAACSEGEAVAWMTAVKSGNYSIAGKTTGLWVAHDETDASGGGEDLEQVGTVAEVTITPDWAY